ncbi:hypothetical protein GH714_035549 [Hevea brasiliensis]|uniref:PGG domain-containing protein n=1 Tax=Hevea brasiliensis TaxID=3981 RepID=A0A6A6L7F0_HEVBR|nr:hypothetical protein GH714_035549 [Hevea brasiliensis]
MGDRLKEAAGAGDINELYALISENANLLEDVDEKPFVDTPLHVAASAGHIEFAMEIMNLKASFVRKLNQDGFSPMHLALQNDKKQIVLWLLDMDKDLVRVKGRGACPESIIDVTNEGDTALHIAVRNMQEGAFKVLLGWTEKAVFADAEFWERELLNWKNKDGDTVLHIAASSSQRSVIKQLAKKARTTIKNSNGDTALDIIGGQPQIFDTEIEEMERLAKRKFLTATDRAKNLRSQISTYNFLKINTARKWKLSRETRNALLVVDALIATITYQAALHPPGGVWNGTADHNSQIPNFLRLVNASLTNTTTLSGASPSNHAGTTVMGKHSFTLFWTINTFTFLVNILRMITIGVPPSVTLLFSCYSVSMSVISPTEIWSDINLSLCFFIVTTLIVFAILVPHVKLQYLAPKQPRKRALQPIHDRQEWWQ